MPKFPPAALALAVDEALDVAVDPPDAVVLDAAVPELPELHPATASEAVAATVNAASHRGVISFIALSLRRVISREYWDCMSYTSGEKARTEALAFTSAQVLRIFQSNFRASARPSNC
jgi:hypothetical protein